LENDSLKKIQTLNEPKRLYSKKYSPSFANY